MQNLYIIAACKGIGKTTASFTVLPEMLNCAEFLHADEIARGLSPLNPEKSAIEAGRWMLKKIDQLILRKTDFAFSIPQFAIIGCYSIIQTCNRS